MDRLLDDAKRTVLAWEGRRGPVVAPMAFWWDGRHVWMTTSGEAGKTRALERQGACAMYVPPAEAGGTGAVLRGNARVFRPTDVLAMATHGAVVAAAQTALAVKNAHSIAGYLVDATRVPSKWLPTGRVMLRIAVDSTEDVTEPDVGPGIAPALPTAVPPEVRRLVAGQRRIVLGALVDGAVGIVPAVWGAGYRLDLPDGADLPEGTPVTAVADHDPGFRPTEVAGIAVHGTYARHAIQADRVRWWRGFDGGAVDVTTSPVDPIVIPD